MKKFFIRIAVILLTFLYSGHLFGNLNSFNFIVSPPVINLKLRPGSTNKVDLTIYNKDVKELRLLIKTSALDMDIDGNALVTDTKNNELSCASWMATPVNNITIKPGTKAVVSVEIKVPYNVNGGRYGIVLFQTAIPVAEKSDVILTGRMGTIFMIEIIGPKKIEGGIKEFKISKEEGLLKFTTQVENIGNIHFKSKGSIIIKDGNDKIIDRVNLEVGSGTILPNHSRVFSATWNNPGKMQPGNYLALLQLQIPGMGKILQEIKEFNIN